MPKECAAAVALWREGTPADFAAVASHYETVAASFPKKPELPALDAWVLHELPALMRTRSPPSMTQAELSK